MERVSVSVEQLIGQHLGEYQVLELVAAGTLSSVYIARQQETQHSVLLTAFLIPITLSQEEYHRFRERFLLLGSKLAQLDHPHILPLYSYGEENGYPFLVTPAQTGGSLMQLLQKDGSLSPERTLVLLKQIAAALDYAHLHGVVHGSLKAGNILLDAGQNVLLTNFSVKQMLSLQGVKESEQAYSHLLSLNGSFFGPPEYMAPELVEGTPPSARSDIYALGILMYELLSGKLPFSGDDPLEVAFRHLEEAVPPLQTRTPSLTAALDLLIQRALEYNPIQRYSKAEKLVAAFERVLNVAAKAGVVEEIGIVEKKDLVVSPLLPLLEVAEPELSSPEPGGWQFRPPIITNHMAAVKNTTGSQRALEVYPPLPNLTAQGRSSGLLRQEPPGLPPGNYFQGDPATLILPPKQQNQENPATLILPPEQYRQENPPTLILPPEQYRQENPATLILSSSPPDLAKGVVYPSGTPDHTKYFWQEEPEPSDDGVDPYVWLSNTPAMTNVQVASMSPANSSMPLSEGQRAPAASPVDKGRRKTLALLATGGVVTLGLLGLGGVNLAHLMQNPARTTPKANIPVIREEKPLKTSSKSMTIGKKSQSINSALAFTNPSDKQDALLIHLPNGNFVAYERACTHEQVPVNYDPASHQLICPRHHSIFDPQAGASVLSGPAPAPLKSIKIRINANGSIVLA